MNRQAMARQRPISLVRDQIQDCLDQAATHLDHYHKDQTRATDLAHCQDLLRQVAGCLIMLELPGALRLISEMQALAQAIGDPWQPKHERCTELLISATLLLPRYLDYVRIRGHETPALLLPTINLMRFMRRAGLIPEHAFVPYRLPAQASAIALPVDDVLIPRVRQLRHLYQVGLLGVLRNHALKVHLRFLSHTLDRLQQLCGEQEPWQLTQGLVEALLAGDLTLDISIKHMFGRVDRHIRRLATAGGSPLDPSMENELRDHLLYYLARATPGSERTSALQTRYQLTDCVPDEHYLEQERQWLQTPDRTATGAVAKALLEDMAEVKSGLLDLRAAGGPSASALRTLLRILDQIALTLEVLGLDSAMRQCRRLARQLPNLAGDQAVAPLGQMADQLISIETTLQAYAQGVPVDTLNRSHCDHLRLAEDNTLGEAHQAIAGIRAALEEYFDPYAPAHGQHRHIQEVAPLLHQVEGALRMLELDELAELLRPLANRLSDQERPLPLPETVELEAIADAIASVEWFLEDYGRERRPRPPVAEANMMNR